MSIRRFKFLLSKLRLDNIAVREENKKSDKFTAAREVFNLFNEVILLLRNFQKFLIF